MQLITVKIDKPDDINFILGQSHFIKTVEDIHEALVQSVPGIKFGLAFCESSGAMLIRWSGTDDAMIELAKRNALAISAGHSFIVFLGAGFFPLSVLNNKRNHFAAGVLTPAATKGDARPLWNPHLTVSRCEQRGQR